ERFRGQERAFELRGERERRGGDGPGAKLSRLLENARDDDLRARARGDRGDDRVRRLVERRAAGGAAAELGERVERRAPPLAGLQRHAAYSSEDGNGLTWRGWRRLPKTL